MEQPNATPVSQNAPRQNELSVVLDSIEERANKATPGPWEFVNRPDNQFVTAGHLYVCALAGIWAHDEDFTFIASSRTDVPALVKALREAAGELQNIIDADLAAMRKDFGPDADRQFREWAQNRARTTHASLAAILTQAKGELEEDWREVVKDLPEMDR